MSMEEEFKQILSMVVFLVVVWICGRLCKMCKLSPLIGWIISGLIFGPKGLKLISNNHSEVWQLLGTLGVTLMIAETGTHVHFDKVRKVGIRALFIALIGTFLPLLLGIGMLYFMNFDDNSLKAGFAMGCSMAPTSVSIALKLLCESNKLNSISGQTIISAAFLDDVFSIILLVILQQTSKTTINFTIIILKILFCFLFLSIGIILSQYFFNFIIPKFLHFIPSNEYINYQPRDEIHLIIMILILIIYSFIGNQIGSHLLGAFIAGMSFSQINRSMYIWRRQMKRLSQWLVKLFFACTVAFTIPINELLSINIFINGLIISLICGIIGKLLSGILIIRNRNGLIIGIAMIGRGEFAYLIAQKSKQWQLISTDLYAIIVWSLLITVIIAPILFGMILSYNKNKSSIDIDTNKGFIIKVEAKHHNGVHFEVVDVLHQLKLDILEAKVETKDNDIDCSEFIVGIKDKTIILNKDKIHEILDNIKQAIGDGDDNSDTTKTKIQLLPIDNKDITIYYDGDNDSGEETEKEEEKMIEGD